MGIGRKNETLSRSWAIGLVVSLFGVWIVQPAMVGEYTVGYLIVKAERAAQRSSDMQGGYIVWLVRSSFGVGVDLIVSNELLDAGFVPVATHGDGWELVQQADSRDRNLGRESGKIIATANLPRTELVGILGSVGKHEWKSGRSYFRTMIKAPPATVGKLWIFTPIEFLSAGLFCFSLGLLAAWAVRSSPR